MVSPATAAEDPKRGEGFRNYGTFSRSEGGREMVPEIRGSYSRIGPEARSSAAAAGMAVVSPGPSRILEHSPEINGIPIADPNRG